MDDHLTRFEEGHGVEPDARFWQHARHPQNVGRLEPADGRSLGIGSCGDSLEVWVRISDERIEDISQLPNGCVCTVACGSAVSKLAKGLRIESALKLEPHDVENELGGLPEDHLHCARLAINTLGEAISDYYRCRYGQPRLTNQAASPDARALPKAPAENRIG